MNKELFKRDLFIIRDKIQEKILIINLYPVTRKIFEHVKYKYKYILEYTVKQKYILKCTL